MKATLLRCAALLGGIAVLLSCSDRAPLEGPRGDLLGSPLPSGLLTCTPLPYDSATQTVGPEGGTITAGVATLAIPAGALDSAVTITAVTPSDTVNRVQFQPQGLTFQQPAALTMSYANCNTLGLSLPKDIVYTTDLLVILEQLPSMDDLSAQTVTGQLRHFSDYAIAW
jgi:hypothetical protein